MEGTDSFLTIDPDVRKCQSTVDYEECTTKHIHDTLKNQCMCLPFNIKQDQVMNDLCIEMLGRYLHMSAWIKHFDYVNQEPLCTTLEEQECIKRVQKNIHLDKCMAKCAGLDVTSYSKKENPNLQIGMSSNPN